MFYEEEINKLLICVEQRNTNNQDIPIPDYKFSDMYITYDRIILKDVTEIRTKSFEEGKRSVIWNNCYSGLVPDQVVVCMNKLDAAN